MKNLPYSRFGRSILHLVSIAYCLNHFLNPHIIFHIQGILREVKGI